MQNTLPYFFDELEKIGMEFNKTSQLHELYGRLIGKGAPEGTSRIMKAAPWLGAATLGGAATIGAQDVKKTWDIGRQVREAQGV